MKLLTVILALVVAFAFSGTVFAGTTYYFDNGNVPANWETLVWNTSGCGSQPTTGFPVDGTDDVAVICPGEDCTMTADHEIIHVDVRTSASEGDGILRIASGKTLTLNGNIQDSAFNGTSDIDGQLRITGTLKLDWADTFDAEHVFTGDGDIIGTASGAKIEIEGKDGTYNPEMIVATTISGILDIETWNNLDTILTLDGATIHANGNGTLGIYTSVIQDPANSLLKVSSHNNAVLAIDLDCLGTSSYCADTCLNYTEVDVFQGTFTFADGFVTEQQLTVQPSGIIDVPDGSTGRFHVATTTCPEN